MSITVSGSTITFNNGATQTTAGRLLQVVNTQITSMVYFSPSGSWQNITGVSASITPTSTSSKILIYFSGTVSDSSYSSNSSYLKGIRTLRNGSTAVGVGDARGTIVSGLTGGGCTYANEYAKTVAAHFVDSPASTSATTYQMQLYTDYETGCIGGSYYGNDYSYNVSAPTRMTLLEIGP
jgi:hypothetical protein